MLDARSFMISTLRYQVGFSAAVAHARLRLSRLELSSGAPAAPPAATRLLRALSFRRPPSSRRGEALWEREAAGSDSLGAASSESAAGSVRLLGTWAAGWALRLLSRPRIRSSRVVRVCRWVWMVVRFG
jgi:hypothetical protein